MKNVRSYESFDFNFDEDSSRVYGKNTFEVTVNGIPLAVEGEVIEGSKGDRDTPGVTDSFEISKIYMFDEDDQEVEATPQELKGLGISYDDIEFEVLNQID
jgi:hypothetical protein